MSSFLLRPLVWGNVLATEPEPERRWVVPDVLEHGDRMILTGNEGEGKSTALRQWGIQVASGIHPFTLQPIEPKRVLLMDLENSRHQIKGEIQKICDRAGIEVPGEPNFAVGNWPAGINLANPLGEAEAVLKEVIKEYQPDLVIGGPLYKLAEVSLADETASRLISAALDRLRDDYGFALVLEAHQVNENSAWDQIIRKFVKSRPQRPFGSSLWRRWPEFGLCLFTDGTLSHWRGDRQERAFPAKLQRDGDVWLWEPDTGVCPICQGDRPQGKERYCSDKCRETAKKRRQRSGTTKQLAIGGYDEFSD